MHRLFIMRFRPEFTLLRLILVGSLTSVCSQSIGQGVSVIAYQTDHPDLGDLSLVNSTDVNLRLQCDSKTSPTEWAWDYADRNINLGFPCGKREMSVRWDELRGYINSSIVQVHCDKFDEFTNLLCRSVKNHSDNVLVKLEPSLATGLLRITKRYGAGLEYGHETPNCGNCSSNDCVKFTFAPFDNDHYWSCDGPYRMRPKQIGVGYCYSSAECANKWRKSQVVPVCIDDHGPMTERTYSVDRLWSKIEKDAIAQYPAGVVVCEFDNGVSAAMDFFFAGKDKTTFHFSLSEISMNDLIWFDPTPTPTAFYTDDEFEIRCKVSLYGLSWTPRLIKVNGSLHQGPARGDFKLVTEDSTWTRNVSIDFQSDGFGPGLYEVECSAVVWNTSEWASQTLKFEVRTTVPPYFDAENEEIIVKKDAANVKLQCDARGAPAPNITWSHSGVPGVLTDGQDLILTTVASNWVNGSTVSCTAVNKFGQWAAKKFKMKVTSDESSFTDGDVVASTGVVTGIVVLVIALLALALGFGYLYIRFVRFERAAVQGLSDQEVKEFQEGRPVPIADESEDKNLAIECSPYNSEFEVAKEHFFVDFTTELGSGQYGVVYAGHINHGPDVSPTRVAVKTVRPNAPIEYFKTLMSELKLLASIGEHESIARLVGADSSNIVKRELYVGIELCKTSLEKHLRQNASRFNTEAGETTFTEVDQPITTLHLVRWAGEIAAGMEYLTTKRIVHADLAARNVLLSFENRAKICDFGLARRLVNYSYKKKTKSYLPWKWMAIESLCQMNFSTMSDVWSFGVTCWEIFSLGDIPYAGIAWGREFVNGLVAGMRLAKPKHASREIFLILRQCWYERKDRRPQFSELRRFFLEQERRLVNSSRGYTSNDEILELN